MGRQADRGPVFWVPGRAALAGALDERQGCFGDVLPAAVEDQGVAAVWDLLDLGGGAVALLLL